MIFQLKNIEKQEKSKNFFKTTETSVGDITSNGIEFKKLGGTRTDIGGRDYTITP